VTEQVAVVEPEALAARDERDLRILEVAEQPLAEVGVGEVVGVEHDDELAVGLRQRGVEVAGLAAGAAGPHEAAHAVVVAQLHDLRPVVVARQARVEQDVRLVRVLDR